MNHIKPHPSLAELMRFVESHSGNKVIRVGDDHFTVAAPGSHREGVDIHEPNRVPRIGYACTLISEPIRTLRQALDWLGY